MATPAFMPMAPRVAKLTTPSPSISSFTPGISRVTGGGSDADAAGGRTSPASSRPRMRVAVATPSKQRSSSAAAAAIRKAGGVDPVTHHVAETLRQQGRRRTEAPVEAPPRWERPPRRHASHPRAAPADTAAAAAAAVGSETAKAWAASRSVVAGTAVGGGRVGGDAVAVDAKAKKAAWEAELAALRAADAVAPVRAPIVAPPTDLPVGGRRATAYEARMARLARHAASSAKDAVAAKAPAAIVAHSTAAGGGWIQSDAVATDMAAKRLTWEAEMAALRAGDAAVKEGVPQSRKAIATNAPVYTPASVSLPQSVTVVGPPKTEKPAFQQRMERLAAHAEATAAAAPPPSAAAERKRRGWFHKRGVSSLVAPPTTTSATTPATRASAAAGAGGRNVVRTLTATGGGVPRPQRLVAAAMAVTLSMTAGLPKGSKRAAALSWLMSGQ